MLDNWSDLETYFRRENRAWLPHLSKTSRKKVRLCQYNEVTKQHRRGRKLRRRTIKFKDNISEATSVLKRLIIRTVLDIRAMTFWKTLEQRAWAWTKEKDWMWAFTSIYAVTELGVWPRERDSPEAAFQTVLLYSTSAVTPWRKAGEQAVWDLASKRSHLSLCAPMPADNCLCRLSTSLFCFPQQGSGAGPGRRCWEVPAGTALYAGDVENWRFGSVTCNLGKSAQSGFFMNLGKAGKIGCKPEFPRWYTLCRPGLRGVDADSQNCHQKYV